MNSKLIGFAAFAVLAFAGLASSQAAACERERDEMVDTVRSHVWSSPDFTGGRMSDRVLAALMNVPRHRFVPGESCAEGYADRPVRIGHGQTVSQPFVVAAMTELAALAPEHTVLEIGTGSGYQAAVLSPIVRKVCTVEIVGELAVSAALRLRGLGYENVHVRTGDGYRGWPECGPFDAVVVTAALGHVPQPLLDQLKPGGRLVMPVGEPGMTQRLTVIEKSAAGDIAERAVGLVRFVPFMRGRD